jgi:hypothetical protein
MDEGRSNNNVVYRYTYHVVLCLEYRRNVIAGDVDERLKQIIREVCAERDEPIVELDEDARSRAPAGRLRSSVWHPPARQADQEPVVTPAAA